MVSEMEMKKLETQLRHLRNDLLYRRLRERDIWAAQQHASRLLSESADQSEAPALKAILDLLESVRKTRKACDRLHRIKGLSRIR